MAFYGLLHLSRELENPYGQDFNDIDLARYQDDLHEDSACRGLFIGPYSVLLGLCPSRSCDEGTHCVVCGLRGALALLASPEPSESLY